MARLGLEPRSGVKLPREVTFTTHRHIEYVIILVSFVMLDVLRFDFDNLHSTLIVFLQCDLPRINVVNRLCLECSGSISGPDLFNSLRLERP